MASAPLGEEAGSGACSPSLLCNAASFITRKAHRSQTSKQHQAVGGLKKLGSVKGLGKCPKIAKICIGSNFFFLKTVVAAEEMETRFSCKIYRCSKAKR